MDEIKTLIILAVLTVATRQGTGQRQLPSEKWLDRTRNKIEFGTNSIENDFNSENFIVDNTDIKPELRQVRDTSKIVNEQKRFNEILKSEDESYNPFGESRILSREIFGFKPKPKRSVFSPQQPVTVFNTTDDGDDDGSGTVPTTESTTTVLENTTEENVTTTSTAATTTSTPPPTSSTAPTTTTTDLTTTRPPDDPPDVPPPLVPETDDLTTAIALELPLNADWQPELDTDEDYAERVKTDIELELAAVYSQRADLGYETVEVIDLREGSIIADYEVIYQTDAFLNYTEDIAAFVTGTDTIDQIAEINITAIEGEDNVKPNKTLLEDQAAAVNASIYETSSNISSNPCAYVDSATLCPAGWTCQPNDDDSINTSPLGIVCESPCSTYFYNECDTDDGYCYLDYTGSDESGYVYDPKCACRDNTITISYDNCMHQNTIIIICSVVGGVLLIAVIVLVVVLVMKARNNSGDNDWDRPAHEFREFPRPQSGHSYNYEDVQPATTTFTADDNHKYTDLKKDKKTEGNIYAQPSKKLTPSPRTYDNARPSSSHDRGRRNRGYDDRYDSDGDRTPPRASRRIPVTDLDEDDYNDPDYYNDNLRKIDTKTKYTIIRPSFMSRSRSPSHSSKE